MKLSFPSFSLALFLAAELSGSATAKNRGLRQMPNRILQVGNLVEVLTQGFGDETFDRLVQYINASGLDYTADEPLLTFFAPNDEALTDLETQIQFNPADPDNYFLTGDLLRYLVVGGRRFADSFEDGEIDQDGTGFNLTFTQNPFALNGAPILVPDIEATNGVIHAVNPLVYPEGYWVFTTVVDYLSMDGDYSTLVSLLQQTGLDEVLQTGLYTIFAPQNSAFDELGAENVAFLAAPENGEALKQVLLYHVVARPICSCDIAANGGTLTLESVQGEEILIQASRGC
jgi:transforming growth factor-beta-induced protein